MSNREVSLYSMEQMIRDKIKQRVYVRVKFLTYGGYKEFFTKEEELLRIVAKHQSKITYLRLIWTRSIWSNIYKDIVLDSFTTPIGEGTYEHCMSCTIHVKCTEKAWSEIKKLKWITSAERTA